MSKALSLTATAATLGVSRNTVAGWIAKGCPVLSGADRDRGVEWRLDVGQVHAWRVDTAVREAVAGYQTVDGDKITKDEADRRRAVAMAIVAEVEADQALGAVVYVDDVGRIVEQEYGVVRQAVLNMTSRTADRCVGKDRVAIKLVLDQAADELLSHLSNPDEMATKAAKAN